MEILRYTAFSADPAGGNPAGVILDARSLSDLEMQAVAVDLGYSETVFVFPQDDGTAGIRYFSPEAEVPFCGHATIAAGVALAERNGPGVVIFHALPGDIQVRSSIAGDVVTASLTSITPVVTEIEPAVAAQLLDILQLSEADLDPALPRRICDAGNPHPVVMVRSRDILDALEYDFDALRILMSQQQWPATILVAFREGNTAFTARNPFPPGGVREDPATGSAAAALGGYLRQLGAITVPAQLTVHQGAHVGRPGVLTVDVSESGGIVVTGTAVQIGD